MVKGFQTTIDLNEKDLKSLNRLQGSKDFQNFITITETLLQAEGFDLLIKDTETKDQDLEKMWSARGGYYLWRKLMSLVDKSGENLSKLKTNGLDNQGN